MNAYDHDRLELLPPSYLARHQQQAGRHDQRRRERRLALRRLNLQHQQELRLRDGRTGYPDVSAAQARYEQLDGLISAEVGSGATRHRRLPWLVRQIPRVVAVIDCVVLFTFCGVIFNVAMSDPRSTPFGTLAALLLAVLASGVAYTWLAVTGERIKTFRDELGEVMWRLVGRTTWLMVTVSLILIGALSMLMYSRVVAEILDAADQFAAGTAVPLGIVFALISAVANLSVIAVHALDGSVLADEHRHAGRLLRNHQLVIHRGRVRLVTDMGRLEDQPEQDLPT